MLLGRGTRMGREVKQDRAGEKRDQIVSAGFECIRDLGYARTTMELVAARAKCTRGGVMYHFGSNKNELTLAVAAMLSERLLAADLAEVSPTMTREERLVAALHRAVEIYSSDESLVLLDIWMGCRTDPSMRSQLASFVSAMNDRVVKHWLERARLERLTEEEDAYRVLFRAAMRGLLIERILHGVNAEQDGAIRLLTEVGAEVWGQSSKTPTQVSDCT